MCTQCGEPLFEGREVDVIHEAITALDKENEKLLRSRFWLIENVMKYGSRRSVRQEVARPNLGEFWRTPLRHDVR